MTTPPNQRIWSRWFTHWAPVAPADNDSSGKALQAFYEGRLKQALQGGAVASEAVTIAVDQVEFVGPDASDLGQAGADQVDVAGPAGVGGVGTARMKRTPSRRVHG